LSHLSQILVKPLDTEKAFAGQKAGKFTFQVQPDASKTEISNAIEKYYGVKVKSVTTNKIRPKTRKVGRGRIIQKRSLGKKAVITTIGEKPIDINKISI